MNNFKRILSLVLASIMLLSMLVACNVDEIGFGGNDGQESGSQSGSESGSEQSPEEQTSLNLMDGSAFRYTVIRPDVCSDAVKSAAMTLRDELKTLSGAEVKLSSDFVEESDFEILVGQTNRAESEKALADLKYNDYSVTVDGKKLVISTYSDEKINEAVKYLVDLLKNKEELTFTNEDQKTERGEYTKKTVYVGDVSLEGYSIVVPKKNTKEMQAAELFQQKIIEISGLYLPIKNDSKDATEKELLIGETNRDESKAVDADALGTYGYSVTVSGTKIVYKTNDANFTLVRSADKIAESIAKGKIKTGEYTVKISDDPMLTSFMFSDVHNNFAMLEPTNNQKKYIVRKNVDPAIDYLLETVGPVDVVLVGGDLISDYHSWNSSGKWPYEYFVEYRELLVKTFKRLSKDGKVSYVAGNHDYAQGELATDGPGKNGSYNSFDFYFGDVGMRQDWGELPEEDMFVKVGARTGEKYLLAYYYEVNGIGFVGLSPDHDKIWSSQGSGFDDECLAWLKKKLDEVDPYGDKVIIVNCHYFVDNRTKITPGAPNTYANIDYDKEALTKVFLGHKNLYHIFGHGEVWYSDTTARYVSHHNTKGNVIDVTGYELSSSELISYANRDFTSIYGGHFRPDANSYGKWFNTDKVVGYAGTGSYGFTHLSTATPKVAQGLYIEVFEDRIVFTMKNFGNYPGWTNEDLITPYTVWLYK